jgi:hypothetical protein
MGRSDTNNLTNRWRRLVLKFKVEYLCGDNGKIIQVLEGMFDFIRKNKRDIPEDSFSNIERAITSIYDFISEDTFSQLAVKAIYGRNFLFQLLK